MCGRYSLTAPASQIQATFRLPILPELLPRYNVSPGTRVPGVVLEGGGARLTWFHWGLVPSWAKDKKIGYRAINARSETARTRPMFRSAFRHRHVLVPIDGFYEWRRDGKKKQPFHIQASDGAVLAVAGLWETWRPPETQEPLQSLTLLTTRPNDVMAPIHDRMPVILPQEHWRPWLDDTVAPNAQEGMLTPYTGPLTARPVSTYVNKATHEGPACQAPPEQED